MPYAFLAALVASCGQDSFSSFSRECVEDHESLDLLLSFYRKDNGVAYVVSLNETFFNKGSRFDGYNFYTFNNETDLWKFIEDVRLRVDRQTEKKSETKLERVLRSFGPNEITLIFEKDVLMKDIAPIIKKLNTYGYKITFTLDWNRAIMWTCNIWALNIPIYHIDKLSKELSVL